jgi:hypothetical protein
MTHFVSILIKGGIVMIPVAPLSLLAVCTERIYC